VCISLLAIGPLWAIRTFPEVACFQIGLGGAGWRVALFWAMAFIYWIPLLSAWYNSSGLHLQNTQQS
jgi:hypothetical protein